MGFIGVASIFAHDARLLDLKGVELRAATLETLGAFAQKLAAASLVASRPRFFCFFLMVKNDTKIYIYIWHTYTHVLFFQKETLVRDVYVKSDPKGCNETPVREQRSSP